MYESTNYKIECNLWRWQTDSFHLLVTFIKNHKAVKKKKTNLLSCLTMGRLLPQTTNIKNSSLIMEKKVSAIFFFNRKHLRMSSVIYYIIYIPSLFLFVKFEMTRIGKINKYCIYFQNVLHFNIKVDEIWNFGKCSYFMQGRFSQAVFSVLFFGRTSIYMSQSYKPMDLCGTNNMN